MEIIDTVAAYALEPGDLVSINDDLVTIKTVEDNEKIHVVGTSHDTGDMVEYDLSADDSYDLFGA